MIELLITVDPATKRLQVKCSQLVAAPHPVLDGNPAAVEIAPPEVARQLLRNGK